MYRQTGDELVFGEDGTAPRAASSSACSCCRTTSRACASRSNGFATTLSPRVAVSLMAQYYATNKAATDERYMLLSRRITESEWLRAVSLLERTRHGGGLDAGVRRRLALLPPRLHDRETPFKDIRDFQS